MLLRWKRQTSSSSNVMAACVYCLRGGYKHGSYKHGSACAAWARQSYYRVSRLNAFFLPRNRVKPATCGVAQELNQRSVTDLPSVLLVVARHVS